MDSQEEQQPSRKQKHKLKTSKGFSVPVKKSDTAAFEMKSKLGVKTDAENTENFQLEMIQQKQRNENEIKPNLLASSVVVDEHNFDESEKKRKKKSHHKKMKHVLTAARTEADEQMICEIPKKKKKKMPKEKITDFDLTVSKTDAEEQELCKDSKKRKKKDRKSDEFLTKKGKKEQEHLVQAEESQSQKENINNNIGLNILVKSKEKSTKKKKIFDDHSRSLSIDDAINCVLERSTEDICEQPKKDTHQSKSETHRSKAKTKKSQTECSGDRTGGKDTNILLGNNDNTELSSLGNNDTDIDDWQEETGTWVQCTNKTCKKWRYMVDVHDPLMVPKMWDCTMNSDQGHNSCDKPQVPYEEGEHIYTDYTIGSIVWAKIEGYPWWPAMVDFDPDTDTYFETLKQSQMVPFQFHVTFFDDHVTRSWVKARNLAAYDGDQLPNAVISESSTAFKKQIKAAVIHANKAFKLSLKERVQEYGFLKRFSSSRSKGKVRTSRKKKHTKQDHPTKERLSKADSPDYADSDSSDMSEDYDYVPVTTASRRKPLGKKDRKEQLDQEKASITDKRKLKFEIKTAKTDTLKDDKISLPGKSSKKDKCIPVDDINLGNGKKNGLTSSTEKTQKKINKKLFKKLKQKSPSIDGYDQYGSMKNTKDINTGEKYINEECANSDNLILCVSNNETEDGACNDELKMNNDCKLSKKSKVKTSSKKQAISDQKNGTCCLTNDVSTHKKKKRKNTEQKDNCEEFSEIGECLTSTKNTFESVEKTRKKLVTKKSFVCHKNEKKLNLCETESNNSTNMRLDDLDTITESGKLGSMSKHLINEGGEEITSGDLVTLNTSRKFEISGGNEKEESSSSLEKGKYDRDNGSFDPDTHGAESIVCASGKNSKFKKSKLILNNNCQGIVEVTDTLDKINNLSAESCAKKFADDNKENVNERIKQKCFAGTKGKIIGRKQMEEGSDKTMSRLKLTKSKGLTKIEKAKKVQVNSPDKKVTINEIEPSDRIATNYSKKSMNDCFKLEDNSKVEADQQIVPDIETRTHDDSDSCSDLPFSDLAVKNKIKEPITHFDMSVSIHDETGEEGRDLDWDTESIKLNGNSRGKNVNYEDNCHDGSDDFILDLDTDNKDEIMGEEADNEHLVYGQFDGNDFHEFEEV